ncbi:vegetative cell wall protein gp1-like [Puntigrus tetrazona]|uniref:vegetative cell wall protein gp1-like n=1 Tax=Puntigrus tetrazona TaxID=1606681 RepID=UPI001C8AC2C5|nr:vegetative cell wall protein gp1-like [Puntigrus tetrazona]
MSTKPKTHKAMGDVEWMTRLRAFASSGAWPSGGNRPAPRQRKWYDLYQKIEKCPLQAHGQTTLFGGSKACSCGFHTTKPATATLSQATAAPPQSEASDTAPAPRSFLRPSSTLSMFTKSRYSGSQLSSLKPNLVERKTPSPSPSSVRTPSASPPSPSPSPSSVRTLTVATVRTPCPSPSFVRTPSASPPSPSPSPSSVRTPTVATVRTPRPFPSSEEPRRVQPTPAEDLASVRLPVELGKTIPVQDQRWIANTLFHSGKLRPDLKLWYEPPIPALIYHQTPTPDRFFTHRLMVWMPYHLWKVTVHCPACNKNLTGYGVHKKGQEGPGY